MASKRMMIGNTAVGGGAPVTIQSMTNTDTRDAVRTTEQILSLENAGCEIVRFSVYDEDCAASIPYIKAHTHIPLVADIHFDHRLAIAAIENGIDKVRINPGNIGSEQKVRELVAAAKDRNIPIRIGVNGGSLEKDILRKYGVTPEGMLESALSHVAILEKCGFYDIVISMKASTVQKTVQANRLASKRTPYPLHLGVTEAGMGEAAMVKSSIGIGSLLLDGIGDTIRVSLTGDPVREVYAAKRILAAVGLRSEGVEVVSCPTCGRTRVDLASIVKKVEESLPETDKSLRIAVMGCAVNGPGEAREADIGIAFGSKNAVVFKKGELCYSDKLPEVVDRFISDVKSELQ
ncbi:MAG: flavodoxin-dependent (E)-4-hydroxy-3-methylbut-2-enyl-diphosphate synthase [Clostridiales bacterium]|nr:flavodoxin-dependent (E)-4-hydroxy-3-methylbut-2-enyl-diphosphate synthase [Clostridiales bacterium]